jgi:hypothetical protein
MAAHGIKWAAIGAVWQEDDSTRYINSPDRCHYIMEQLLENNIDPWLWGYPWRLKEIEFVARMKACSFNSMIGWILNPELGLKSSDKAKRFMGGKSLFWAVVRSNPYRVIGMSTYGSVIGHPTFPWDAFGWDDPSTPGPDFDPVKEVDFGSAQLYDQPPHMIRRGLAQFRDAGFDVIVPSYGTYRFDRDDEGNRIYPRMTEAELSAHFQAFVDVKEEFNVKAMIGWSEAQISRGGWRAIERFAPLFG